MNNRIWRGMFSSAYEDLNGDNDITASDYVPRIIVAPTREEAMRQAEHYARENFPAEDGWGYHTVDAVELPRQIESFGADYEIEGHYGRN
jgi:hypothetical protein